MSISEQLEQVRETMCSDYCKYPMVYHDYYLTDRFETKEQAQEAMEHELCEHCPLRLL